jgi:hypothetical protein
MVTNIMSIQRKVIISTQIYSRAARLTLVNAIDFLELQYMCACTLATQSLGSSIDVYYRVSHLAGWENRARQCMLLWTQRPEHVEWAATRLT